jgi:DNA invertase Pin-like site-specific DNA recombinase
MEVAIYVRNSTNEERQNPQTQIRPLIQRCEREGWDYEIFQEFASGSKESRPELDKMMVRIRQGEFKVVLVWRLDRLGRSLKHLLQLIEEFKNKGVKFISLTEGFDTMTPQGELFFSIAGAFAQFERKLIQERINAGLKRVKEEGKSLGRPKGSRDKKVRRKSGYHLRWVKDRQEAHRKKTKTNIGTENFELNNTPYKQLDKNNSERNPSENYLSHPPQEESKKSLDYLVKE